MPKGWIDPIALASTNPVATLASFFLYVENLHNKIAHPPWPETDHSKNSPDKDFVSSMVLGRSDIFNGNAQLLNSGFAEWEQEAGHDGP